MVELTRPKWLWRVLLLIPAAACWIGAAVPFGRTESGLLDDRLAHRFHFQIMHACLVLGAMPDVEAAERRRIEWEEQRQRLRAENVVVCDLSSDEVDVWKIVIALSGRRARRHGVARVSAVNGGQIVIIALWLVAIPMSALALPLLNAFRLARRRSRRARDHRCVACGYDLTGNVSGVCPECGNSVSFVAPPISC